MWFELYLNCISMVISKTKSLHYSISKAVEGYQDVYKTVRENGWKGLKAYFFASQYQSPSATGTANAIASTAAAAARTPTNDFLVIVLLCIEQQQW